MRTEGKIWAIADMVIDKAYPNWHHIPNKGILRGAIAKAIRDVSEEAPEPKPIEKTSESHWTTNCLKRKQDEIIDRLNEFDRSDNE